MEAHVENSQEIWPGVKKNIENYLAQNDFYLIHEYLLTVVSMLENLHQEQNPQSKIGNRVEEVRKLLHTMKNLSQPELAGNYLVWLTTVAKKLQELAIYNADIFVSLGLYLLTHIENNRKNTDYLSCNTAQQGSTGYSLMNSFNLFKNGGPFGGVVSAAIIDGIVAPFAQDEFKLFSLIPLGFKNRLGEMNEQFSHYDLEIPENIDRELHRYRLPRIGKIHKDHQINVFEATYSRDRELNNDSDTVYIVGFHGNAFVGHQMLQYLDKQALKYFAKDPTVKRLIVIAPDYPGSAASGGKFSGIDELAHDSVVLIIKHLIKRGVSAANILTLGHSLGGAILMSGLHQLIQEGIITTAVSLNSFAQAQKFMGDSSFLGSVLINHYNVNASLYFQQLPKERRHVEHTNDDEVIPLPISLIQSLEENKDGFQEGLVLNYGGHDLSVHDLSPYITKVKQNHHLFQAVDDETQFQDLRKLINPIIYEQRIVKSNYVSVSSYEDDDESTMLGQIKCDLTSVLNKLTDYEGADKTKILIGFLHNMMDAIEKQIQADAETKGFSLFSKNKVLDALKQVKINLEKTIFNKEMFSEHYLTSEFLSDCQERYMNFMQMELEIKYI